MVALENQEKKVSVNDLLNGIENNRFALFRHNEKGISISANINNSIDLLGKLVLQSVAETENKDLKIQKLTKLLVSKKITIPEDLQKD